MIRQIVIVMALAAVCSVCGVSDATSFHFCAPKKGVQQQNHHLHRTKDLFMIRGGGLGINKKNKAAVPTNVAAGGQKSLSKADVIQVHAWASLVYGALFALESFDITLPHIGFSDIFKDFSSSSTEFTKASMRVIAGLSLFTHVVEKELATNEIVQKAFGWSHIVMGAMAFLLAKEGTANKLGVVIASAPLVFGVLFVVAK